MTSNILAYDWSISHSLHSYKIHAQRQHVVTIKERIYLILELFIKILVESVVFICSNLDKHQKESNSHFKTNEIFDTHTTSTSTQLLIHVVYP